MELIVSVILVLLAAAFVALPFVRPEEAQEPSSAPLRGLALVDAARQKRDAYAAIKEAEFDFEMSKLSEPDFKTLRDKYAAQALAAIAVLESETPGAIRPSRPGRVAYCPQCGSGLSKRANFCGGCGKNLKQLAA